MNIVYIISIISLSFCIVFFFYFRWYIKRRTSASELLAEYRTEVYRLIAEIDGATDRDSLLVEDRIKKLKAVLEETDKRLSVYTKELERSRSGEALYTSLGRGIRAALDSPSETAERKAPQLSIVRPNIEAASQMKVSEHIQEVKPQLPAEKTIIDIAKHQSKHQIRARIEELAAQEIPPAEIASRLDISLAEVELAMNLIKRKRKN
jgi:hypothetical protein